MASLPAVRGKSQRSISILLINPNSTAAMTDACLETLSSTIPESVTISGFTAPRKSPSAIEGHSDGVL